MSEEAKMVKQTRLDRPVVSLLPVRAMPRLLLLEAGVRRRLRDGGVLTVGSVAPSGGAGPLWATQPDVSQQLPDTAADKCRPQSSSCSRAPMTDLQHQCGSGQSPSQSGNRHLHARSSLGSSSSHPSTRWRRQTSPCVSRVLMRYGQAAASASCPWLHYRKRDTPGRG